MAQKYPQHGKRPPLKSLEDLIDEGHKEALEERARKVRKVFSVASELFDRLNESGLTAEGRLAALQILNTLHARLGGD